MPVWERNKTLIIYFAANALCLFFIVFSRANFTLDIKKIYAITLYPLQYGSRNVSQSFSDLYASISELSRLKKELASTRKKILRYENMSLEVEEIKRENARLKDILEHQRAMEYLTIAGAVVAKDPQNFYSTIIINRGENHGVKIGMPVIAYQNAQKGLVGKVVEVSGNYSKVIPLIDPKCSVGVMLEESRHSGILVGQSPKSMNCLIHYIDRDATVEKGISVITSGMGGVYPKGITVGTVAEIDKKNYGLFQDVYLKPAVNFAILEDVYVIKRDSDDEILELLRKDGF